MSSKNNSSSVTNGSFNDGSTFILGRFNFSNKVKPSCKIRCHLYERYPLDDRSRLIEYRSDLNNEEQSFLDELQGQHGEMEDTISILTGIDCQLEGNDTNDNNDNDDADRLSAFKHYLSHVGTQSIIKHPNNEKIANELEIKLYPICHDCTVTHTKSNTDVKDISTFFASSKAIDASSDPLGRNKNAEERNWLNIVEDRKQKASICH
ncbi:uncharacterized protein L201_007475 [Kwoniella dendrophila CBS 6074]|uniref:Uncharacterized protein n=1 Tax=Kwoniella dendrophila CBS 6074 TaxID=1295534 RepID=A0AAX4K467_9TREE